MEWKGRGVARDQAPHGGKKEKNWRGRKKSASEASREVAWEGERVAAPFSPLAPPLRNLVPCEERGESTFYPELFFFLHGTKEATTAVFGKNIPIPGLAVDCG